MSRVRTHAFGPGSMESITLRTWRHEGRWRARAIGHFTVFCGAGNDHTHFVDQRSFSFSPADGLIGDAHGGDVETAWVVARELVEWSLEGWTDPCDREGEEDK